jgi:hypothetical protein
MSFGIGLHDPDCSCPRCEGRRAAARLAAREERTRKINNLHYELCGVVRAFLDSKSMKALADRDMDFEWWFLSLAKKSAEIEAAEK